MKIVTTAAKAAFFLAGVFAVSFAIHATEPQVTPRMVEIRPENFTGKPDQLKAIPQPSVYRIVLFNVQNSAKVEMICTPTLNSENPDDE